MPNPSVNFKVLARGYKITGDVKNGYKATVPYITLWKDAFTFVDDIFGGIAQTVAIVGPIQWYMPYKFPASNLNIFAQSFSMEPCGADGDPATGTYKGLKPGEFFTHALITVEFITPPEIQNSGQDPGNLNQLDPNNPLTMCEQNIQMSSKMTQGQAGMFLFSSNDNPLNRDFGRMWPECKLVLTFPRVPYLPWKLLQPYVGTVNERLILNCAMGTLLLEGMDTKVSPNKGQLAQQVQLHFQYRAFGDWNSQPSPYGGSSIPDPTDSNFLRVYDGFDLVYRNGGPNDDTNRIYAYKDFSKIFDGIQFQVV